MARVFLDANQIIDVFARRRQYMADILHGHKIYTSPLNIHIFCYVFHKTMPDPVLARIIKEDFQLVAISGHIAHISLQGPTSDYEDNIQLHSAVAADCEILLTNDKQLLKMGYFGKTRLVSDLADR